ncbi:MAG: hypothetical protein IPM54_03735 [Polyangiaceae bacterium]|nr:hypothetical protein [Polyangiaceae bacterium]
MNVRPFFFASIATAFVVLAGCGTSSNPEGVNSPDDVSSSSNDATPSDSTPNDTAKADEPANDTKEMPHGAKSMNDGNSVPDDYSLTDRDCIELAKQYETVQKADQMAALDPRLTSAQKQQAEKAITDAIKKLGESWENGCRSSLVGGVVDRNRLKCAMESKTVKGFDECINGEPPK